MTNRSLPKSNDGSADSSRPDDGKRFVVRADEKLTAFVELESAICVSGDAYS